MLNGAAVRRTEWGEGKYWMFDGDCIVNEMGNKPLISGHNSADYEIFEKEHVPSRKLYRRTWIAFDNGTINTDPMWVDSKAGFDRIYHTPGSIMSGTWEEKDVKFG
jgi:hypothetical protein